VHSEDFEAKHHKLNPIDPHSPGMPAKSASTQSQMVQPKMPGIPAGRRFHSCQTNRQIWMVRVDSVQAAFKPLQVKKESLEIVRLALGFCVEDICTILKVLFVCHF
jgi:hypothetical protein